MKLLLFSFLYSAVASAALVGSDKTCTDYSIPVSVQSENWIPAFPPFRDNYDVVEFANNISRRDTMHSFIPFSGKQNVTAKYVIGATFCTPSKKNGHEKTVLLATHGLGYDRRYWASDFNPEYYNFVDFAIARGYSVFFYDRLGTGKSSKVSGFLEGQAAPQLAILAQISTIIRQGHYTKGLGVPKNLVHVGHSFGSFLSHALLADYPQLSDGAVLTGIGYNGTDFGELFQAFRLNIATSVSPGKWPGRNNGYLTWSDIFAGVSIFFHGDSYDEEAAWYGESIKQPLAAMEFLTLSTLNKSSNFTGPVLAISGEFDFPSCGGNCYGVLEHPLEDFFSNANPIETVVHPKVGHGINLSYNATGAYKVMLDFVDKHIF